MKDNKKFWILFAIIIALSVGTQLVVQELRLNRNRKLRAALWTIVSFVFFEMKMAQMHF